MDEGKIVLVGNETDVLHCGYSKAISDAGKRYPSADHYAHSQILSQLGLGEHLILELLSTSSSDVPQKAKQLLQENMPTGHDMNSLASYLQTSRQSYTMQGLRLRVEQDELFERTLLGTKEALLIVCDSRDRELGIGMEEQQFVEWMQREKADAATLSYWIRNEATRPAALGNNQLGYFLMWLRYEVREKKKAAMLDAKPMLVDGLSTDNDDNPVKIAVNNLIISLTGIFRPLSNYYPLPFEMKGERYRSVEHYAYQKMFNALRLDDKLVEKISTTVSPLDVPTVAQRVFDKNEITEEQLESKRSKMDRWRQSAMKHKVAQNEYLQQLLLSTGDALIVDNAPGDLAWSCAASESELQRLGGKQYVNAAQLVDWMREGSAKPPRNVSHLRGNKTGLLLMELRAKLAANTTNRIPLVSPLQQAQLLTSTVSPHVICLTAESVFHPLYPAEIRPPGEDTLLPSPAHMIAQHAVKYLGMNSADAAYVMEASSSVECWQRLSLIIEASSRGLEREQSWWMERRQTATKEALQLLFEQHPPLLRALLDTQDALLVYCSRFTSEEAEMSVGMRECDLRAWMHHVHIGAKQLMELCMRPMAFRPAMLGGNRLGLLLMELRREFVLRGVFPQQLPELPIGVDAILGTDSPTENLMVNEEFDVLNPDNYTSIWINPLLILARDRKDSDLMAVATQPKLAPRLVTVDEEKINDLVEALDGMCGKADDDWLCEVAPEDLRAVFMKLCTRIRGKMRETEQQQQDMNRLAKEIGQLQSLRRGLEERIDAHKERERTPPMRSQQRQVDRMERQQPMRRRSPGDERRGRGDRDRSGPRRQHSPPRRQAPPPPRRERTPEKKEDKPAAPPKPKQPRPADEELSEGEILSSDED